MHARELVELGALVAVHGSAFMHRPSPLTDRFMEQYWVASRCRHDRWIQGMSGWEDRSRDPAGRDGPHVRAIIEEVLLTELLTRTWAAVAVGCDRVQHADALSPIVRGVLAWHVEARNRAMQLMVHGGGFEMDEGAALNRLRRQTERWTDMMMGYVHRGCDVAEFAFCSERARDFAADLGGQLQQPTGNHVWNLTLVGLRSAFQHGLSHASPNAELNQRIAGSVLGCFHSEAFEGSSWFKSLWTLRLDQIADNAQFMIDDLFVLDQMPAMPR
ncbi:MAG: hypothetical protein FJ276_02115 [Planctomycetes bacterium]|nr:hypothetical protein [Planctomycetota bacterium]